MSSEDLNSPLLGYSKTESKTNHDSLPDSNVIPVRDEAFSYESPNTTFNFQNRSRRNSRDYDYPEVPIGEGNLERTSSEDLLAWRQILKSSSGISMRQMSHHHLHLLEKSPSKKFNVRRLVSRYWDHVNDQIQEFYEYALIGMNNNHKLVILGLKAGLTAGLVSIMCVLEAPYDTFKSTGVWAVLTVDLLFERSVGMSIGKGINRTAGTLVACLLAFAVNTGGPYLGSFYAYLVVFCVFLGGTIATFFRFQSPFKDKWNYAVVMSQLTFHILILSGYNSSQRVYLPFIRMGMIILGFFLVAGMSMFFKPTYAGDSLHSLVPKNFIKASQLLERCVQGYLDGTVLDHVPHIWSGVSKNDDKLHNLYHEVIMSDAEVVKLMNAVNYEPSHAKFFRGYPWYRYGFITDFLRYVVYEIIGLDSCLRAEIQAPIRLRNTFEAEIDEIASHCTHTLIIIGNGIKEMKWVDCHKELTKAEEGALRLQHKIGKEIPSILMGLHTNQKPNLPTIPSGFELPAAPVPGEPSYWSKLRGIKQKEFIEKNESIHRQWDATTKRLAALSFVKYASLLLEIVAKMNFVIEAFDELAVDAKFENAPVTPLTDS